MCEQFLKIESCWHRICFKQPPIPPSPLDCQFFGVSFCLYTGFSRRIFTASPGTNHVLPWEVQQRKYEIQLIYNINLVSTCDKIEQSLTSYFANNLTFDKRDDMCAQFTQNVIIFKIQR